MITSSDQELFPPDVQCSRYFCIRQTMEVLLPFCPMFSLLSEDTTTSAFACCNSFHLEQGAGIRRANQLWCPLFQSYFHCFWAAGTRTESWSNIQCLLWVHWNVLFFFYFCIFFQKMSRFPSSGLSSAEACWNLLVGSTGRPWTTGWALFICQGVLFGTSFSAIIQLTTPSAE